MAVWHGAEHVGEDVWHGAKDVGEFVVHHPGEIVKALEDAGEMVAGALAVAVGEAAIGAGVVLSVTGVGAVAGVPLAAEGVALAGLGIGAGVQGAERLTKDINQMRAEANTDASGGEAAEQAAADEGTVQSRANAAAENAQVARSEVGAIRELTVARLTGGRVLGEPGEQGMQIVQPGVGKSDVDVLGPNGEYIAVGGPAKAANLSRLGQKLSILKYAAAQANVPAQAYFVRGTPQSVVDIARRILGEDNVFEFGL